MSETAKQIGTVCPNCSVIVWAVPGDFNVQHDCKQIQINWLKREVAHLHDLIEVLVATRDTHVR